MQRRAFIEGAGLAGILAGVTAPAFAQAAPEIKWRLASSFPKSLDAIFGGSELIAKRVAAATNNRFQIQLLAAGEVVPALQVADAVQNGTVQCGHTASYYYVGKDPTFAFGTAVPFGLNCRQFNAWWHAGGGNTLMNEFYQHYGMAAILAGNTGAQMGGWFRKEIKSVQDLRGLKMRIGGLAGQVLTRLGVVAQQIPAADVYPALEKGTIDAAEWVGPYDDEKLGLNKVAKFYYYPGWWEGSAALHLFVNLKAWEALPKDYRSILESACHEANSLMTARYDAANPAAIKRLVGQKVQVRGFPRDVMQACFESANTLYAEIAAKNARFKHVHDQVMPFRNDAIGWFRFTENTFDNFMAGVRK